MERCGPTSEELARKLALPGETQFAAVLKKLDVIKWGCNSAAGYREPFPRSQIYAALRGLREAGKGLGETEADAIVESAIGRYAGRACMDRGLDIGALRLPTVDGNARGPAMDLALIATLWDYANPFEADFPRFAERAGGSA
jgi:hypothetical protein